MPSQPLKLLVTRTDRLGDVLLALPTLCFLRKALPNAEISFLVKKLHQPVVELISRDLAIQLLTVDDTYPTTLTQVSLPQALDAALCLYNEPHLLKWLRTQPIPLLIGNYSKWNSFWSFDKGILQRRSHAKQNEAEYNLELARLLLKHFGCKIPTEVPKIELPMDPNAAKEAETLLHSLGIENPSEYAVVHPGMGGSALNFTPSQYARLIGLIRKRRSLSVLVSVGPLDAQFVDEIEALFSDFTRLPPVPLNVLMEIFRKSQWVIAPSTGPLHLAHLVGASTFGVFSPVLSQHKTRWEPFGGIGKSVTVFPDLSCPAKSHCLLGRCPHHPCMEKIPWKDKLESALFAGA